MQRHEIQKSILTKILSSNGLRYRDMKPEYIENDLYNYHLQYLVKEGLVSKESDQYRISSVGKRYIEEIAPLDPAGISYDRFRVNILAGVIRNVDGKIELLNQRRTCHPFYGDTGIIGGAVKKGERIEDAAKRKLREETGLEAEFTLLGVIRKTRYTQENELFSDILFHICFAGEYSGELIEKNEFGENFWAPLDDSIQYESEAAQGSMRLVEVLKQLKATSFRAIPTFYYHETKILPSF